MWLSAAHRKTRTQYSGHGWFFAQRAGTGLAASSSNEPVGKGATVYPTITRFRNHVPPLRGLLEHV